MMHMKTKRMFESLLLLLILTISAFLNTFRLHELMLFIGDAGRDYLAARDMIVSGTMPLVGIPSSVIWLHQGPISIYLIGIAFLLGNFHPVSPALLFGLINVVTTYLVFLLGRTYFNRTTGLFTSAFYAVSPMIVVNARMPYHTSLIPFFTALFFLLLLSVFLGNKKLLPVLFFALGLLLQVELSNIVVVPILLILLYFKRKNFILSDYLKALIGFVLGTLPFLVYDITHGFVYSVQFPLWIVNRIRLFFGLTLQHHATTANFPGALATSLQQLASIIFPQSLIIVSLAILLVFIILFINRKRFFHNRIPTPLFIVICWLIVPLMAFVLHTTPGTAYFPLIFPALSLLIGYSFYLLLQQSRFFLVIFFLFLFFNATTLITNDFFVTTKTATREMSPFSYNFGSSWKISEEIVNVILSDAKGRPFGIKGEGFVAKFPTALDTYTYLIWWHGGKVDNTAKLTYIIADKKNNIPNNSTIIYQQSYTPYVARYE